MLMFSPMVTLLVISGIHASSSVSRLHCETGVATVIISGHVLVYHWRRPEEQVLAQAMNFPPIHVGFAGDLLRAAAIASQCDVFQAAVTRILRKWRSLAHGMPRPHDGPLNRRRSQ